MIYNKLSSFSHTFVKIITASMFSSKYSLDYLWHALIMLVQ